MKVMKSLATTLFASLWLLPITVTANSGEGTYKAVCAACHAAGVANAPKMGDQKKWAPLIREGQAVLTAHGYVGIRGMPAKGGRPDLSVEDFAQAVVYMANQSGASWQTPDAKLLAAIRTEIEKREKVLAAKSKK